jgi:hypothetical protein
MMMSRQDDINALTMELSKARIKLRNAEHNLAYEYVQGQIEVLERWLEHETNYQKAEQGRF